MVNFEIVNNFVLALVWIFTTCVGIGGVTGIMCMWFFVKQVIDDQWELYSAITKTKNRDMTGWERIK